MNVILNKQLTKKNFDKVFNYIFHKYNLTETTRILDSLKLLGAVFSTKAGLSLSLNDLRIINKKKKIQALLNIISYLKGDEINDNVFNVHKINDIWNNTNNILKSFILTYLKTNDPNNQLLIVLESGARGSKEQIHQLIGLRSLMVDQSGTVVPFPIKNSFIDGLSIFEYLLSSFGARKGIIDTALKTADSGYLTRRLIESSYEIKIVSKNCVNRPSFSNKRQIFKLKKNFISIKYSVLNCSFNSNICQRCFGLDYSTRHIVDLGENIGLLSAHSISEPSTQLTMRTFHTGGVFTKKQTETVVSKISGFLKLYKKQQEIQLTNWRNEHEKFPIYKIKFHHVFFNKNQPIAKYTKINEDILPIYICILSRNTNRIFLTKQNNQLFNEIYKLYRQKQIGFKYKDKTNIIRNVFTKKSNYIQYILYTKYFFNINNIFEFNTFMLKLCI